MKKDIERNTIFLYPELDRGNQKELLDLLQLVTDISQVVNMANRKIDRILNEGGFSFINCMPTVLMQCISALVQDTIDYTNVRICVVKFNQADYTANYSKLLKEYKSGRKDISHLVALHIVTRSQKTRFLKDPCDNFDVIIETNLDSLENVLVSIMLDISLYHYFALSNELDDRKDFNKIKYEYLVNQFDDASALYANDFSSGDDVIYLPISFRFVKELRRREIESRRAESITNMQKNYCAFLASSMGVHVFCNERGSILNHQEVELHCNDYNALEKIIKENARSLNKFIVIIPARSTEDVDPFVVYYDSDDLPQPWGDRIRNIVGSYSIFTVVKRSEE